MQSAKKGRVLCLMAAALLALSGCGTPARNGVSPDPSADTNVVVKGLETSSGLSEEAEAAMQEEPATPAAPPLQTAGAEESGAVHEGERSPSAEQPQATDMGEALPEARVESTEALPAEGVVTVPSLNLRAAPNTESTAIGSLAQGDRFTATHKLGDWYYVQCALGEGYVSGHYTRLDGEGLKTQQEALLFYDDVADQFVTVEKEFYMASWQGSPRRFDAKLSPAHFGWEGTMAVVHPDIQAMAQKMARALYQSDSCSVNCYFGQYYPSAAQEDGTVYETGIHEGIDFGGPALDAPFYSLTDGLVTSVQDGTDHDQYNWIGVKTGDLTVFYVHHSQSFVQLGESVQKGQKLGLQGDNGAPGAYHVHLEVVQGDAAMFNRSKDTVLQDDPPYDFWRGQGY